MNFEAKTPFREALERAGMDKLVMMKILPTRWNLIRRFKGKRILDIGGVGDYKNPIRQKLFYEAWAGCDRTTMDVDARADIVVDLNKLPLPEIAGYDAAVLLDVLEHLKYPAVVLEWLNKIPEILVNFPAATLWEQRIEELIASKEPTFHHLFSWSIYTASELLKATGWRIIERGYLFDYQSWRGKLFSASIATRLPRVFAQGVYFACKSAAGIIK